MLSVNAPLPNTSSLLNAYIICIKALKRELARYHAMQGTEDDPEEVGVLEVPQEGVEGVHVAPVSEAREVAVELLVVQPQNAVEVLPPHLRAGARAEEVGQVHAGVAAAEHLEVDQSDIAISAEDSIQTAVLTQHLFKPFDTNLTTVDNYLPHTELGWVELILTSVFRCPAYSSWAVAHGQ